MIRNVVLGRLRDEPGAVETARRGLEGIASLDLPGMLANHVGYDEGLRGGGWSYAITNDWVDADAYRHYDADPGHNEHRALLVGVSADVARVQFSV